MTCCEPYLVKRCEEIECLLKDASIWAAKDEKLGAHLASYISVLIVGVIEDCIEHLISQRVHKLLDQEVQDYVVKTVGERFRNPDWAAISGLLKDFAGRQQQDFRTRIPHNGREASALESLLGNKNSLAHNGTTKLQISIKEAEEYYQRIVPILEAVESFLLREAV